MKRQLIAAGAILFVLGVVGTLVFIATGHTIAVASPQGTIARQELNLIIFGTLLSVGIIVPVFALTIGIAWKYRATNTKAKYRPDFDRSRLIETIWWLVPAALILTLSIVTWTSSHRLDPYRALASTNQTLTIQVVALDWKWLFIYPEQQIATVNYVRFPANTPIDFQITSDAPMNSFWIPQLGGQMYAMPGMSTHLHLMADASGSYRGVSANISGRGFAGMKFTATSTSQADFDAWAAKVKSSTSLLDLSEYKTLAKPSENNPAASYTLAENNLYDEVIMKYTVPTGPLSAQNPTSSNEMSMP